MSHAASKRQKQPWSFSGLNNTFYLPITVGHLICVQPFLQKGKPDSQHECPVHLAPSLTPACAQESIPDWVGQPLSTAFLFQVFCSVAHYGK